MHLRLSSLATGQPDSLWLPRRALWDNRQNPALSTCPSKRRNASKITNLSTPTSTHGTAHALESLLSARLSFATFWRRASRRRESVRDRIGFLGLIRQAAEPRAWWRCSREISWLGFGWRRGGTKPRSQSAVQRLPRPAQCEPLACSVCRHWRASRFEQLRTTERWGGEGRLLAPQLLYRARGRVPCCAAQSLSHTASGESTETKNG